MADGEFSADRKWWWDGTQWMSATSDDGHWQWDGAAWKAITPAATAAGGTGDATPAPGFLRQIPGYRSMTPWKVVLASAAYCVAAIWVLAAIGAANPGMALMGLGLVALGMLGANGWGMRSRLPGVRSSSRLVAVGTWVGLCLALVVVSAMAAPSTPTAVAPPAHAGESAPTATPLRPVAESTPPPTSKPTATPRPSPSPTETPTTVPTATPTVIPTAAPTAVPIVVPAPLPPPPPPAPAADPYAAATAAGASAVCADGSWSFSAHRSGTCSHHGGVHWWTGNLGAAGPGNN
jgi:hypothetical protein